LRKSEIPVNRLADCSPGIHESMRREEAERSE
jgi:hypothetical protein